jgi:hypothetical protein
MAVREMLGLRYGLMGDIILLNLGEVMGEGESLNLLQSILEYNKIKINYDIIVSKICQINGFLQGDPP